MQRNKREVKNATLIRVDQRKTRKRYTCQICNMDIVPGSQRVLYTYKGAAGYITLSHHIHCDALLRTWDEKIRVRDACSLAADSTDADEMREDIWNLVCRDCEIRNGAELPGSICFPEDLLYCPYCLQKVLPPSMIGAALDSLQENDEY